MGGALPIHTNMMLYARDELRTKTFRGLLKGTCLDQWYIFKMDDIKLMLLSHVSCILLLVIQFGLDVCHRKTEFKTQILAYIRQFLKLLNVCFYVSSILYV